MCFYVPDDDEEYQPVNQPSQVKHKLIQFIFQNDSLQIQKVLSVGRN